VEKLDTSDLIALRRVMHQKVHPKGEEVELLSWIQKRLVERRM
jgi:hypothetical protein